jgi:hypothetical protein
LSREAWRRENVNTFIHRAYNSIKAAKPWVKFGVSPFGIWRPGNPPPIDGLDAYAKLYADSRKWLAEGWLDYFVPQLYWTIEPPEHSYATLLKWWARQNARNRVLAPGLASFQWSPAEILNQIRLARQQPGAGGHVHWSMKSLLGKSVLADTLERQVYGQAALPPAFTWLGQNRAPRARLTAWQSPREGRLQFRWSLEGRQTVSKWLLQSRLEGKWRMEILPGTVNVRIWPGAPPEVLALTAVDRNDNLGLPAGLRLAKPEGIAGGGAARQRGVPLQPGH